MREPQRKVGILIGRFQVPEPHEGHRFLINRILETVDSLLILVGSANRAPTVQNPYSYRYRSEQLCKLSDKIRTAPINDYLYSDSQWMVDVEATIKVNTRPEDKIILFGHKKDGNDYLGWFPNLEYVNINSDIDVSGTEVRKSLISSGKLPETVVEDFAYFEAEKRKFSAYPYLDSLNVACSDVVLECSGQVLLIRRKHAPGRDTWALPGGHKHSNETHVDCAIRELIEETNVRIPEKVLRGSIVSTNLFDSPKRSLGVTRTTLAVHIRVQPNADGSMPRANGCDDAAETKWVSIREALNELALYDDHGDIISVMTKTNPLIAIINTSILTR